MRVAFTTLGCKVNQYETENLSELFAADGFEVVDPSDFADVYVINSCTVTASGDKKTRQLLRRLKKQNPAAVAALTGPQDSVKEQCAEYERRNKALCGGLRSIGWNVPDSPGTMFVWAPLPEGYTDSAAFTMELMEKTGMIVTPGSAFGDLGEGYVRMALVHPVPVIEKAIAKVQESGILKK